MGEKPFQLCIFYTPATLFGYGVYQHVHNTSSGSVVTVDLMATKLHASYLLGGAS